MSEVSSMCSKVKLSCGSSWSSASRWPGLFPGMRPLDVLAHVSENHQDSLNISFLFLHQVTTRMFFCKFDRVFFTYGSFRRPYRPNRECWMFGAQRHGDLGLTALLPVWRSSLSSFAVWSFYSLTWSVPLRENATAGRSSAFPENVVQTVIFTACGRPVNEFRENLWFSLLCSTANWCPR